jgi:ZIP family zinc transporter
MTEGFGIAGPLTGQSVSWKFIVLAGLIGGGPTFLGTIVGIVFHSPQVFLFCLALAAGAIIYVVAELLGVAKRFKSPEIVMWGLLVGFPSWLRHRSCGDLRRGVSLILHQVAARG